jgi:DHA3 family tetracycline resistance protein-like MFS transporter
MRRFGAFPIYLLLSGTTSLSFSMVYAIEMVYQINAAGLNPFQLVIVGTLLQCIHLVFQTPMGVLADMYSRRLAVVIGLFILGLGYLVEGAQATYVAILAGTAIGSFGYTIMSGADSAWIADELGADHVGRAYLRAAQVGSLAGLPAIGFSAVLGSMHLNLPILVSGCLFVALGFLLLLIMPEQHFSPADRVQRMPLLHMGHTIRASVQLIRGRPVLRAMMGITICAGIFSAGFDRLWSYHLLAHFSFPTAYGLTVVIWFGIIEASINVATLVGSGVAQWCVDWKSRRALVWALFAADACTVLFVTGFAVASQFGLALGLFWLSVVARGPRNALMNTLMNMDLDSSVRATVFSMQAQVGALAGIVGGPILGALATDLGTRVSLVAASVALVPTLALYRRIMVHDSRATLPGQEQPENLP